MNIKSLLLGSAAAMVAVSSAQAADAVVVEPEPVEYVRVCDAYGSGFFYIPGTETCIRFSGYVRSSYEKTVVDRTVLSTVGGITDPNYVAGFDGDVGFNFWGQRARLNIDVRNETDWGTLRAQYRLEGGDSNTDANIDMDRALISLAGFRAGFTDNYWSTNHGYAGVNFTGLGAAYTPGTDEGWYGFDDATIFDYTWAGDGFSITIGVEDPRIVVGGSTTTGTLLFGNATNAGGPDSRANFYAGFNYSGDGFGVAFTAVHDSTAIDVFSPGPDVGGWAYKVSADLDLSEFIPGGILHVMYMTDGDYRTSYVHNWNGQFDPESIWQIAFQASLTDELQLVAQYSHSEASGFDPAGGLPEGDAWNAGVGLNWFPAAAPGFSLRASYKFGEFDNSARASATAGGPAIDSIVDEEYDGFFVSVRRDF